MRQRPPHPPSGRPPTPSGPAGADRGRREGVSLTGTFAALRSVPYRWLWTATLSSTSGRFAVVMVSGWLAFRMTHSAVGPAVTSLLAFLPALFLGPPSGALADRLDRRRLMQVGAATAAATCLVAAALAGTGRLDLAAVFVVALAAGVDVTLEQPSRVSLVSVVSAPEHLLNAFALIRIPTQGAEMVGPALATAILVRAGPAAALAVCGALYLLAVLQLPRIALPPRPATSGPAKVGVARSLGEGLTYVRQEHPLGALMAWVGLH